MLIRATSQVSPKKRLEFQDLPHRQQRQGRSNEQSFSISESAPNAAGHQMSNVYSRSDASPMLVSDTKGLSAAVHHGTKVCNLGHDQLHRTVPKFCSILILSPWLITKAVDCRAGQFHGGLQIKLHFWPFSLLFFPLSPSCWPKLVLICYFLLQNAVHRLLSVACHICFHSKPLEW